MVVSQKVQQPVNYQEIQLIVEAQATAQTVAQGSLDGNYDIPQELRMDLAELSFRLGKGNHVGRIIAVQVLFIDGLDLCIIDKDQT